MSSPLLYFVVAICILFGATTAATTVTFGQSAAFTGGNGQLGQEIRQGILAAFKEVNDAGGIKGNILLNLVSYDDAYEPANTTVNTQRLISQDNVFGLIGYVGTATTQAALQVRQALDSNMPVIAPATGSMAFRLPTDPSIVNIRASYLDETTAMVDYLVNQRFVSRISILYQNDAFGQAGYTALNGSLAALGLNFQSEGSYVRNTEDVDAAYQSILGGTARPQAIVMFGTYAPLAKFVGLAKALDPSIIFITVSFVNAESFVNTLITSGISLNEVYISEAIPLHSNEEPYLIREYERALYAYNISAPISSFSFEGYVTGRLTIELLSQAYPEITHENFLNVLVSSQYFTLSGLLLGPYSKSCNQGMRSVSLLKIDTNGSLVDMPETKYTWDTCLSSNGDVVPPIVFGQSAPLLGSVMDLGIGMRQGILASFLARNKQGGVRNRKLVLLSRDDGYEPDPAAANANYFIQERNVFGLVGSVGTAPSEAILPIIDQNSVPFIGALTGASSLRTPCDRNVVNVRASYIDEVAAMAQHFVDNLGLRRISIFYQNDGFGSAGLEGLQLALKNRSMTLESQGSYERNTFDLADGFSSVQEGDPQAIVLVGTYDQLAQFIQMALAWKSDLVFGTVSFVDSEAFAGSLRTLQVSTDNIYVTQVVPDPTNDGNQLVALYQNAMLARDASSTFGFVSLEGYVVAEFLIKVLDSIDSTLEISRETFTDTVFSQTIFLVGGQAIGPFSGSADNCTCNQGLHRIVTTRISSSSNYSISEVPENAFKFETCGVQYPENFVPVSDGVRGGVIAASCACVGAAITFIVLSLYHRESKTIKHSSLTFSLMTLVGAGLMMFSPVLIVLVVPQCMVWLWFVCIGFILFFGSMAVKSYRIDRIFNWHRKKLTKIKPIGDSQLMVVVSVLLGLEVVLLIIWQIFGELRPLEFEGTKDAIFGCYSDNSFPFMITQIVYFGVVFLVGCFFAFRTRNVNFGSYKETKEIFFAVYNMTLLFIIVIPLVALIGVNDTTTAAIITSIGLLFSSLVSILCLYVLKFYRIINKREKLSLSSQTGTPSNPGASTGRSKISNVIGSGSARAESINEQYKSSDTTKEIDRQSSKN